jgi:CRISPR/Cas system-associated exonuclease Cas4 (RecB family)
MLSGKSIHKNDFVQSGFGLAPDFIDWKKHVVIERKNSQSYEAATIMQLLFYMTMLTATTEIIWSGNIQYIRSKQLKEVILSEENIKKLDKSAEEIHAILFLKSPPFSNEKNICKQCSFGLLCFGSTDQEWEE